MMRKKKMWMGNVVMGDDCMPVDSYLALDQRHLKLMLHSIYGVQQIRSQSLSGIKRSDIGRNKKEQSLKKQLIMINANLECDDYVAFEEMCMKKLADLDSQQKLQQKFKS